MTSNMYIINIVTRAVAIFQVYVHFRLTKWLPIDIFMNIFDFISLNNGF